MVNIGLQFFNSKNELCMIKTVTSEYIYIELVDDIEHYKIYRTTFDKYLNQGKYVIATEAGKLLYG